MPELTVRDFINIHLLIERDFKFKLGGGVRDRDVLETIVERPKHGFYSTDPFSDVFTKAASIFEGIVCWQPFVDGNKRTALVITRVYLAEHGYSFFIPLSAVRFTVQIAKSKPETQVEIDRRFKYITRWIRRHSARPRTFLATVKFYLHVGYPIRTMVFLALHGFNAQMSWLLFRWFAFDIYPEYRADLHKMMVLLMQLDADSLRGRRKFRGIARPLRRFLTRTGSP
jgi:death-on-curing family protein